MDTKELQRYFDRAAMVPGKLGGLDCVRFVIEGIWVGWGKDFSECLRYNSRREAVTQLREDGGLYQAFASVLGEAVPRHELTTGDIAYFPDSFVGLVMPGYIAVKLRKTIIRVPMERCAQGWKWDRS